MAFAHDLGRLRRRHHLLELALEVARRALDGEVSEDDANAIYLAYRATDGRADPGLGTVRVQASKLRQIIRLVNRDGKRAMKLLETVMRLHESLPPLGKFSCYDAMVLVARRQLKSRRALTDAKVREIALSLRRGQM